MTIRAASAAAIRDGLLAAAERSAQHRRLYLRDHFGVNPGEVFAELRPLLNEHILVPASGGGREVRIAALRRGRVLVIPYLVDEQAPPSERAEENRGLRGYAGTLRTDFAQRANPDDTHVLVVLDSEPFETILTAAEDAAELPTLGWASLVQRIAGNASGPARGLVELVAADLIAGQAGGDRTLLDRFAEFAAYPWSSVAEAGRALPNLACYLADPAPTRDRLRKNAEWRAKLDLWSLPDRNLRRELSRLGGDDNPGVERILQAYGPGGLDYTAFDFDDLQLSAGTGRLDVVRPLQVRGMQGAVSDYSSCAVWIRHSDSHFTLTITGATSRTPTVSWHGGDTQECVLDDQLSVMHVPVPGSPSASPWSFGTISLRPGATVNVALFRSDGAWFPVERSLRIDPQAGCFRALQSPVLDAIGHLGRILGDAAVVQLDEETEEVQQVWCSHAGARLPIPVMVESLRGPDPGPEPPLEPEGPLDPNGPEGPDAPTDPDGPIDPGDPDAPEGPESPEDEPPVIPSGMASSAAHAVLHLAAARRRDGVKLDSASAALSSSATKSFIVDETVRYDLEAQTLTHDLDGLYAEARIIELGSSSEALAFAQIRQPDGGLEITADRALNRLRLDALDGQAVDGFWRARREFLAALREAGTAHAVLCGEARDEANRYVEAYEGLLRSIPETGRYSREYDRVLLVDLVSSEDGTQCWLAPTNPVTVAWMLSLLEQLPALATGELPERDIAALTPRFLLPLFHAYEGWWEIDDQRTPLLWRRYRPVGSSMARTGGSYRTVLRRIDKFLRIFPAYNDPRQRLAIAFREPGDGSTVAEALRAFYASELRPGASPGKPRLDVTVYTQNGVVPEKLAGLMAPDSKQDRDHLVQSRVTLTILPASEEQVFAHICFAFRTQTARRPRDTRIDERCPTAWVGGLAASVGRFAASGSNDLAFTSGLFLTPGSSETLPALVERTLGLVGGQPDRILQPGITQATTTVLNHGDLDAVQRNSVWTVHADRLLGLEAFSYQISDRKSYIVDFDDRTSVWQAGLDSVTVTERVDPYRTALGRAFLPYAHLADSALPALIDYANAVSGSWNLDLLNAPPNGIRERLGFLAAISVLKDLDAAFEPPKAAGGDIGGVLLPLDDMFRLLAKSGVPRPTGRSCDDLLYLRLFRDSGKVRIRARLLEIKYKSEGVPDLLTARKEIERTRAMLQQVAGSDGASRPFRARDLAEFVRSGAIRNQTFGLEGVALSDLESAATDIAQGNFDLTFSYLAGEDRLYGDVISLELENMAPATRTVLDVGQGLALGYVRLGRPAFEQLARDGALQKPSSWPAIRFLPGDEDSGPLTGQEPPPPPDPAGGQDGHLPERAILPPDDSQHAGGPSQTEPDQPAADGALAAEIRHKSTELDRAAIKYGLQLAPFDPAMAQIGPSVIRFRTRPLGRESIANVRKRSLDLGREVGFADGLLIDQEPYYITVDVPRAKPEIVRLENHLHELDQVQAAGALPFVLGMAPGGQVVVEDLARLPHLLVAGATGSGKSVLLRGLLCCLARARSPMQLQIMIVDPKQVDFMPFHDLMHLVGSRIVTDPREAVELLAETLEREVAWRRDLLTKAGVTSALEFYEQGGAPEQLPQMVILVDEFADLAASLDRAARDTFLGLIQRFGQLTRAFGIYLVLATQRPSVQVITGDIKANLTARVALKVQSAADSVTILGRGGAESLRPGGDLIFDHGGRAQRLQALYAGPADVRMAKAFWIAP